MSRRGLLLDEVADVLDALPELQDVLTADRVPAARHALRARAFTVRKGRWDAWSDAELVREGIGFLVTRGAIVRCVTAAHRTGGELLGPGDLLRPSFDFPEEPPFGAYLRAISDVRLAVLDARFCRAATQVPETIPAIMTSVSRRTNVVARQLVIVQSQAVEARIMATLQTLAERWGRVTADGVVLPGWLSHGTLSLLLGARRPSVTSAMVRLTTSGQLERRADGRWVIPPAVAAAEPAVA